MARIRAGLISIATENLPALQTFYRTLLGVAPAIELAGVYVEFRLSGLRLGIYRSRAPAQHSEAVSLCLQVDDLDEMLRLPVVKMAQNASPRQDFHGREVDLSDPDGNRVVLHQPAAEFWRLLGDL